MQQNRPEVQGTTVLLLNASEVRKALPMPEAVEAMKGMTLEFCGIQPVGVSVVGSVKRATDARMHLWKLKAF